MIVGYSLFHKANKDNIKFHYAFITFQLADMLNIDEAKKGCVIPMSPFKLDKRRKQWNRICVDAGLKAYSSAQ